MLQLTANAPFRVLASSRIGGRRRADCLCLVYYRTHPETISGISRESQLEQQKLLHDATEGATTPFLVPYCAWLGFVIYINGGILWLNRGRKLPMYD